MVDREKVFVEKYLLLKKLNCEDWVLAILFTCSCKVLENTPGD